MQLDLPAGVGALMPDDLPTLAFATPDEWSDWLAKNHAQSKGLWLKFGKKQSRIASVTYEEALQLALCWGWIDGQKRALDDRWWLQKFCPRGPKSIWSKGNRDRVLALIEGGRMTPAGLAEVERAKQDGRWDAAYAGSRTATVPDDLAKALAANREAAAFFKTLESRNRYAILWRIETAKRAETRATRIAKFVDMLARHEKLHP